MAAVAEGPKNSIIGRYSTDNAQHSKPEETKGN
jgi:hypothetical protein